MRIWLTTILGAGLLSWTLAAQPATVRGTLIDNACFKPAMSQQELAKHARECALMEGCVKSGYVVVTDDGHVYKLDTTGNAEAVAALKASTRASDLKVTVTGTSTDGTIAVASLVLEK